MEYCDPLDNLFRYGAIRNIHRCQAHLGSSVGAAGDVNGDGYSDVIVGADIADNDYGTEGMAFAYYGSASGLAQTANWIAVGGQRGANFGHAVAAAGDVNGDGYADVIVGAPYYDNGQTDEGGAFVYYGSAAGLNVSAGWRAESNQGWSFLGYSVDTAGDVNGDGYADVIVGAPYYDNGQEDEGRAFVYHGSAVGLSATPDWTAESNQAWALFGYSVGAAGDVNHDGYDDVIVGAPYYDNGQSDQAGARFGFAVGAAGNVNGDSYADVIVGAPYYDNGQEDEGRAFVYYGSASGLAASANWTAESDLGWAYLGYSVGTAGDVNGDGYDDVIIGAPNYDNGQTDEGRALVYHGSASGLAESANWWMPAATSS